MTTINVAIHPKSKAHLEKFKKALELIDLQYELQSGSDHIYSEDFIKEIKEAEEEFQKGESIRIKSKDELETFLESL